MSDPFRVRFDFPHGLGDCVQFTVVLKHIQKHRPDWVVDLVTGRGKEKVGRGLTRAFYYKDDPAIPPDSAYSQVVSPGWWENYHAYPDRPTSKITNYLAEDLKIDYDRELASYQLTSTPEEHAAAAAWMEGRGIARRGDGKYEAVVLHYQGNTSPAKKNLTDDVARAVVERGRAHGLKTILLDFDGRSPIAREYPDWVACPVPGSGDPWGNFGSGDVGVMHAMIEAARLFVGIDSGPGKVASAATSTPALIVWTGHHPLQFHDPASNTTHLVPRDHGDLPPVSRNRDMLAYFAAHYRSAEYDQRQMSRDIRDQINRVLNGQRVERTGNLERYEPFWVRIDNHAQDLVIVQDVYEQDSYRTRLYDLSEWRYVVDVGAHIGTFTRKVLDRSAKANIACVEACHGNHTALQENVGREATIFKAAMTYEAGKVGLLNAVRPNCESTGGSVVVPLAGIDDPNHPMRQPKYQYVPEFGALPKVTLEEVMAKCGMPYVDCLKLDCEGSEFSILANSPAVAEGRVRFVFGEFHGRARWEALRREKFADWHYSLQHDGGETGVFHLVNPAWKFGRAAVAAPSPGPAQKFEPAAADDPDPDMHRELHQVALAAAPSTVTEIGVRGGHSALALLDCPTVRRVVGIDNYSDPDGAETRARFDALVGHNDHRYARIVADAKSADYPPCDMVFVDGDHTFAGATFDIKRAAERSPLMVVDDYYPTDPASPVTAAVNWFVLNSPTWRMSQRFVQAVRGKDRALAVLHDGARRAPPVKSNTGPVLRLAVPGGIGDVMWVMTKVPAILARLGARGFTMHPAKSTRAAEYLKMHGRAEAVGASEWEIVAEPLATGTGAYNYAPSQPNWHNEYDLFLQANGHLENGRRLQDWFPALETDWRYPVDFEIALEQADGQRAANVAAGGPYITAFAGPMRGNTEEGHNRGEQWKPRDWAALARSLGAKGVRLVFLGAGPGDEEYMARLLTEGLDKADNVMSVVGGTSFALAAALVRGGRAHVGYQSGLGVLACYSGVRTAMWWRRYGDPILPHAPVTFREEMATAWVPPAVLEAGEYMGAIYGLHQAGEIAEFLLH